MGADEVGVSTALGPGFGKENCPCHIRSVCCTPDVTSVLVTKPRRLRHALLAPGDSNRTLTQGPLTLLINTTPPVLAAVKVPASTWIFPEDTLTPRGGGGGPPKGHKEARCFTTTSTGRSPSRVQKVTAARLLAPPSSQTAATKGHGDTWQGFLPPCCSPALTAELKAQAGNSTPLALEVFYVPPPRQPPYPGRVRLRREGSLELCTTPVPGTGQPPSPSRPIAL